MQYSFYTYLNKEIWNQKCTNLDPATKFASVTQICFQDSEMLPLPRESQPYASMPLRLPRRLASKTRKSCPLRFHFLARATQNGLQDSETLLCHENLNLTLKNWGKPHTKPSFIRLESRFRKESGYSFFQTHPTLRTAISCETFAKN